MKFCGNNPDEIVETDVTFDDSWHRRGHRSNYVEAVIDVDTGLVLDDHTASKFCLKCSKKEHDLLKKKISQS